MSSKRIKARVPIRKTLGAATLSKHKLAWHKVSSDGSGKCDAVFTGNSSDEIQGVLFAIAKEDKHVLDGFEGLGNGYEEKCVSVCFQGKFVDAFLYVATDTDVSLLPYSWYKQHVLAGAREHGLAEDYIDRIERTPCIEDTDVERRQHELGIYFE